MHNRNERQLFEEQKHYLPSEFDYSEVYKTIARELPEDHTGRSDILFIILCGIVAVFSSIYNYTFSRDYIHDVAKRWNFSDEDSTLFGEMCGLVGLLVNLNINTNSIQQAYLVVKDEILKRFRETKKQMPDDNTIKIITGVMALVSMIGAIPNLKFVYDSSKKGPIAVLIFMEIIQFITISALNLRGLYNSFKVNSENQEVAQNYKEALLKAVSAALIAGPVSDKNIKDLSRGNLVEKKFLVLRKIIQALFALGVGGYTAAFFAAAQDAVPKPNLKLPPIDDLISFVGTGCSLLSCLLKWFLLGNAYIVLIDRLFSLFDTPILKTPDGEIRSGFVSRNGERLLTLVGLIVSIFSLGSSSKIVEKYFFKDVEKTTTTLALSFGIGGGAAFGINGGDTASVAIKIINFGAEIFKKKRKNYSPVDRFGETHDAMLKKLMHRITLMPNHIFLEKFTMEFLKADLKLEAEELGVENYRDLTKDKLKEYLFNLPGLYMHGRQSNDRFDRLMEACGKLRRVSNNTVFQSFKNQMADRLKELEGEAELDPHSPLLSRHSLNIV